jgi:hypothetical protein
MSEILKNLEKSSLGFKGKTPGLREAAKPEFTIHSPLKADDSKFDLDGKTPKKYLDGEFK